MANGLGNTPLAGTFWTIGGNTISATTTGINTLTTNDYFGIKNFAPLIFVTNNIPRVWITETGNVGVGKDNPVEKLEVEGNVKVSANITAANITAAGNVTANNVSTSGLTVTGQTNFDSLRVNNKIKIGTSSLVLESLTPTTGPENNIYTTEGSGDLLIQSVGSNSNTILNAKNNIGNVGIGLLKPFHKLSVSEGHSNFVTVQLTNSTTGQGAQDGLCLGMFDENVLLKNFEGGNFSFFTNNSERARIRGDIFCVELGRPNANTNGVNILKLFAGNGAVANAYSIIYHKLPTTDRLAFVDGGNVEALSLLNGGNVGVGTKTPEKKLHVLTDHTIDPVSGLSVGSHQGIRLENITLAGTSKWDLEPIFGNPTGIVPVSKFTIGPPLSPKFTILQNGNTGIGTTEPISLLHTTGTFTVGNSATAGSPGIVQITNGGGTPPILNRLTFGTDGTGYKFSIATNKAGALTDLMTIKDNGAVGIGTTDPGAALDIKGGVTSDNLRIGDNGSATTYFKVGRNTTTGNLDFTSAQGTYGYTFMSGNVGIGAIEPKHTLDVRGHVGLIDHLIFNSTSTDGVINWPESANLWFRTNATPGNINTYQTRMFIKGNNGFVGIGNTAPETPLDVEGSITIFGGNLYFGGNGEVGGGRKGSTYISHPVTVDGIGNLAFFASNLERMRVRGDIFCVELGQSGQNTNGVNILKFYAGNGTFAGAYSIKYHKTGVTGETDRLAFVDGGGKEALSLINDNNVSRVGIGTTTPGARLHIADGGFRHGAPGEINIDAPNIIGGRLKILENGNVGIGATNPGAKLEVNGIIQATNSSGIVQIFNANASTAVLNGVLDVDIRSGNTSMVMVKNSGNVGIGCTSPAYKLDVNGLIRAKEFIVENFTGCDFVFEDSYKRMRWNDKREFYRKNRHLPGVDAASVSVAEGLKLSKNIKGILQNVEEDRLDITELFEELSALKSSNKKLSDENALLKKQHEMLDNRLKKLEN